MHDRCKVCECCFSNSCKRSKNRIVSRYGQTQTLFAIVMYIANDGDSRAVLASLNLEDTEIVMRVTRQSLRSPFSSINHKVIQATPGEEIATSPYHAKALTIITALRSMKVTAYRVPHNRHKMAKVEFHPLGVVEAIVSWNYPFHNLLNPVLAAVFFGNGIVVKVSEHASWSGCFYVRIYQTALAAVGDPENLVEVITGFAETAEELVSSVDKMILVGSL
ncbi:hypothetical protein L1987_57664 [Smallanthus sonchifolius]|uniref:Uncharacterized protein n=1 Tax=Smallanthus sonchifolius TaxID=185202 RepID=A0ACB9DDS0_9ASTR|nr:hypothetical protein L1987_57664 [Smallanthus sonchifolius]